MDSGKDPGTSHISRARGLCRDDNLRRAWGDPGRFADHATLRLAPAAPAWQRRGMDLPRASLIFAGAVSLASCGGEVSPAVSEQGGEPIECALAGNTDFGPGCRLVEVAEKGATYFIVRHNDGGFRRLELAETETGFVAGDGAEESTSYRDGDYVVLTVGGDRYRWKEPAQ